MPRFRPLPILSAVSLVALAVLIALGGWQLHRLEWKTALLADLAARAEADPAALADVVTRARAGEDRRFVAVQSEGSFTGGVAHMPARARGGSGWRTLALFEAADEAGVQVVVDMGVRPGPAGAPDPYRPPEGRLAVRGLVGPEARRNTFTPPADTQSGVFYMRDVDALGNYFGADPARLAPFTLALTEAVQDGDDAPRPAPPTVDGIANRHFEYALTWFGLAAALAGVYAAFHIRAGRLTFS